MSSSILTTIYEARIDRLCAELKALSPKLSGSVGSGRNDRAAAARDALDGMDRAEDIFHVWLDEVEADRKGWIGDGNLATTADELTFEEA